MTAEGLAVNDSLSIDDAIARIKRHPPVRGTEHIGVSHALRRILAEDVVADAPVPAHDSSAMDGYAFRFADLAAGRRLRVEGRVAAGHPLDGSLTPRTAARIFTGGAMPEGADTVAMQEFCHIDGDAVVLPADITPGANRRAAGEDVASGATVLTAGTRLRPQDIGIATAVGRTRLMVRRQIKVGVIATGDELRPPGKPLPTGCIHDTNRHTVTAALRSLGAEVTDYGIAPDRKDAIRDALLAAAAGNDLIISTGGVSAGEEDHVRTAVQEVGSLDFWKLPLKPGRPVTVGAVTGIPFIGLPGNPVSAMVTFWLVGRPFTLQLMGATSPEPTRFPVVALFDHGHRRGRRELLRARLRTGVGGRLGVETYSSTSSGMLSSLTWSDGLVEIPEDAGDVNIGDIVSYIPYHGLDM